MPHPISLGYLDLQIARVDAVLPVSPNWDATPLELFCPGFDELNLSFTYDPNDAAANPAFDFQIQVSPYSVVGLVPTGGNEWITMSLYAAGAVVAGADSQSLIQREYITYTALGVTAEAFVYGPIRLAAVVERIRVLCRESGDLANPGNLQIEALFSSKQ